MLMIGLFGLFAVASKFLAAGILYLFVDGLTGEGTAHIEVPVIGIMLDVQQFFVAGVIAGTILMMLATAMQFGIRRWAAISAALFEERCVRRVIAAASCLPHPQIRLGGDMVRRADMLPVLAGARSCNVITRQVVQLTPSLIGLTASLILLNIIDPWLTAVIMLAFVGVVILQYPMTNRSVRASDVSEIDRRAAMSDMRSFVDRLSGVAAGISHDHVALNKLFGRGSAFQQDIRTFTRRIDGMILGDMTARIGNSAILAGLFIFVGTQILSGARDWASFAAYVAIARFTMKDFQTTGKILGQIGRLFLPVERYMRFIQATAGVTGNPQQPAKTGTSLALKDKSGRALTVPLEPDQTHYVLIPKAAGDDLSEIYALTTNTIPPALVDDSLLDPNASIRINLTLEASAGTARLEQFVQACAPSGMMIKWPEGWLDQPLKALPADASWALPALKAAAADLHGRPGIIMDARYWQSLGEHWHNACREHLRCGPVFISAAQLRHLTKDREAKVIIAEDRLLTWYVPFTAVQGIVEHIEDNAKASAQDGQDDEAAMMM